MDENCSGSFLKDHLLIHAVWCIATLILIIVGLVSLYSIADIELGRFIEIASAFTSVILAVLAIIYAFISNSSLFSQIGSLNSATEKLDKSATRIEQSSTELSDHIRANTENITSALNKLNDRDKQVSRDPTQAVGQAGPDESARKFLIRSSLNGVMFIFAVSLAKKCNKLLVLKDYLEIVKDDSFQYASGFAVGAYAAQLINYDYVKEKGLTVSYSITFVHSYVLENIERILRDKIAKRKDPDRRQALENQIKQWEMYFG